MTCTTEEDPYTPGTVQSSDDTMLLPLVAIVSCIVLLAFIIPSCLCCFGIGGKKCCWYDCFGFKKNNLDSVQPTHGADQEIYQALSEIAEQTGLPPSKTKAYVEILEQHDIYNKNSLFLNSREELDNIA